MAKPEWGTKRQCPKCGEKFYDLKKAFPLTCIECSFEFEPESLLKSKQTHHIPEPKVVRKPVKEDDEDDVVVEDEGFEGFDDDDAPADDDAFLEDDLGDDDVDDVLEKRGSDDDV